LQILDDGRVTDSQGRAVNFRNTVIIMTSNIGSPLILERAADLADPATAVLVENAVLAERKLSLEMTDEAKELIAEEGYDPAYGARPLKRAIQKHVQNPLAIRLLEGEFEDGDRIRVDREPGAARLTFEKAGETVGAAGD
ncbi:MAG TPA: AAA family ATPase, partial [Longimicrobiaceae bacterium]|nr:AAA family ATPase [Longimicrobiaceae bacterium]